MTSLTAAVRRSLRDLGTPRAGETVLVALSGGPDSVALLDAMAEAGRSEGFRVVAAHLDHGLRPSSPDDVAFCRNLCEAKGVSILVGSADVRDRARRECRGLEDAAREERYAFLRRAAFAEKAVAVAVAHTRDDQAETLLLRLVRGSGSLGLSAMRARTGDVIRPLLDVSRAEVLGHLATRGLAWREDETNADTRMLRNRVRHELLPYLEARFNPRLRETLARTASLLADEADALSTEADAAARSATRETADGVALQLEALRRSSPAIARLMLRGVIAKAGGLRGVSAIQVERLLRIALRKAPSGRRLPLPGGREARFRFDEVLIRRLAERRIGRMSA
jgi:tRNA(Ile)-lysidine synthase